jgi:hypothetical protein
LDQLLRLSVGRLVRKANKHHRTNFSTLIQEENDEFFKQIIRNELSDLISRSSAKLFVSPFFSIQEQMENDNQHQQHQRHIPVSSSTYIVFEKTD